MLVLFQAIFIKNIQKDRGMIRMKIGIMSMQRVANYGSFLQAFGLKKLLEDKGHEVFFIDFHEGKPVVPYKKKDRFLYKLKKNSMIWELVNRNNKNSFYYLYIKEYLPLLGIDFHYKYNVEVDLLIVGSDEVFNCIQSGVNIGFSKELLGNYRYAKKVVTYAASCGYTTIDKIKALGIKEKVRDCMMNFSSISVRDQNTKEFVKELLGKDVYENLDPVLVSNYENCIVEKKDIENYIILYSYESRKYSLKEQKLITDFAKKNGKQLITIGKKQDWIKKHINATPFEFLGYIKNADFVLTDTFHGTVFSLKYNVNFATIIRESNKQKLEDLLKKFELQERKIENLEDLDQYFINSIDFAKTNEILLKEMEKTNLYLENIIKNE